MAMKRRSFLSSLGAASVGSTLLPPVIAGQVAAHPARNPSSEVQLAGMSLQDLRKTLHDELFEVLLPFWDQHGVDHEHGGVICSLDYDGTLVNSDKLMWFQGRAIWVYSFLYNNFGQNPSHLEIARKTKDFVLKYGAQKDGWWSELLSREGKVLRPFGGDIEGIYFIAEGLQEYAVAAQDHQARDLALALLKKLFSYFNRPEFRYAGPDFRNLTPDGPCVRPQGTWMLNLNIATQILNRWNDPEIVAIAEHAVDAIINHHYNPEIGLNTEMLYYDFSRPAEEQRKSRICHGVEVLWMVMDEANRRRDSALWNTCAERIHHHLDAGWDQISGGISQWVNVDQGGYHWPPETPVGTNFAFRFTGEYNYMKTLWGMNEVMVGCLNVFERTGAEWAAKYFGLAYQVITEKFSQKKRGLPGYMLFTDRRFTPQPNVARQDNYHPLRQAMLNLLTLDRMIKNQKQSAMSHFLQDFKSPDGRSLQKQDREVSAAM